MSQPQSERLQLNMQNSRVEEYRALLADKAAYLALKRLIDIVVSFGLICLLLPVLLITAAAVGLTSPGGVFFLQRRVGKDGRIFRIIKFRTMVSRAPELGGEITVGDDDRITPVGRVLRRFRFDELPQFVNVLKGDMSIIGPRPEVESYVNQYGDDALATLLVRPGLSCNSSLHFANEAELLEGQDDPDKYYVNVIMPEKAAMNLDYIRALSFKEDCRIFFATIAGVFK